MRRLIDFFVLPAGEPLYFLSVESLDGASVDHVDLVEAALTSDLREQLRQTAGVVGLRKGVMPLFRQAAARRAGKQLIPPEMP